MLISLVSQATCMHVYYFSGITTLPPSKTCTLALKPDSREKARKTFLTHFQPSDSQQMVMYITLTPEPKLNIPDRNDLNKILEWQWVKNKNLYFVQYPVDLDILTFGFTSSVGREDKITLLVDDPDVCTDVSEITNIVADLLWKDIFYNDSKSYLCNRNMEKDKTAKEIVFGFSMVWVGYDLSCSYFQQKTKVESIKESGPVFITYVCFFISLFYPLIFKILNLKSIIKKLKIDIPKNKKFDKKYLTSYQKEDIPFGFQRFILTIFYKINYISCRDEKEILYSWNLVQNIASCRLVTLLFVVLCTMSAYRYYKGIYPSSSYGSSAEYPDVYRIGLPVQILREKIVDDIILYFGLLFVGHILLKINYVTMCGKKKTTMSKDTNLRKFGVRPIGQFIKPADQFSNFFTMRFIDRFNAFISIHFWSSSWNDVKKKLLRLKTEFSKRKRNFCIKYILILIKIIVIVVPYIIMIIFYIFTCCFPVFWLVIYGSLYLAQSILSRKTEKSYSCYTGKYIYCKKYKNVKNIYCIQFVSYVCFCHNGLFCVLLLSF